MEIPIQISAEEIDKIMYEYIGAFRDVPNYLYLPQPKNFIYKGMKVVFQNHDPDDPEEQYPYVSSDLESF